MLEFAHDEARAAAGRDAMTRPICSGRMERAADSDPGDDLISALLHTEVDGAPIDDLNILGMAALTLIAGVDTTWSSIGSSMLHLATHPGDVQRLVDEPRTDADHDRGAAAAPIRRSPWPASLWTTPSSPGVRYTPGDKVILNFPAANHDPAVFDRPDEVILDHANGRVRLRPRHPPLRRLGLAPNGAARRRDGTHRLSGSPRSASPRTRRSRGPAVKYGARATSPSCSEPSWRRLAARRSAIQLWRSERSGLGVLQATMSAVVYVCRKCEHGRKLGADLEERTDATVRMVGCQKVCSHDVVGVRHRGAELTWFEKIDSKARRKLLRRFVSTDATIRIPKPLRRLTVGKRANRVR